MISWRFSLNDISHAHMPRIMNELQTSPPQEQETSARAKLIETRRGQTGGHNKNHMNSRNDRISSNTRIAKEQKENKKEETSEGRKEELGPEKTQPTDTVCMLFLSSC